MARPLHVLFVGLGSIGQRHLRNLWSLRGADVAISCYRARKQSPVLTDSFAVDTSVTLEEKYGLRTFDDLSVALDARPDAVFICNPTSLHMSTALAAARAGCHLFIEKPLSHMFEGVDELLSLVERRQLVTLIGFQMRFHPGIRRLQALIAQRAIGTVVAARVEIGEYLPDWHKYEDYRQTYPARAELGGGAILTQTHEFDYLYALFGMPTRIFALGGHLSRLEVDVEDIASILMEFTLEGKCIPVHLQQDYLQAPPRRRCEIIGDAGKIYFDLLTPLLQVFDGRGIEIERQSFDTFSRNQLFLDEMAHFLACLARRETPIVSLRDGVNSLRIALAAKASLATGAVASLTDT